MADRNRRKSSILKPPKSNARAPLQDVNSLPSSQEEDVTSHTALARRRVSFAGKNFVKEFCSEADIASVYHAPEYEELLASSESSGLVASDSSSNTHSSTTYMSDNNSTFASKTQLSAYQSLYDQNEDDPTNEIMRQFKGKEAPKNQQLPKPSGKNRLSFGDIRIPNFEEEDDACAPAAPAQTGNNGGSTLNKNINFVAGSTVTSQAQNIQVTSENINISHKEAETAIKVTKTELLVHTKEVTSTRIYKAAQSIEIPSTSSPVGSDVSTPTMIDDVFETPSDLFAPKDPNMIMESCQSTKRTSSAQLPHDAGKAPRIDVEPMSNEDTENADITQCMNESMDFTRAVPGIIHLGCYENPGAGVEHVQPMPQRGPSVDERQLQVPEFKKRVSGVGNRTVAMDTSMEFTRPIPSNIQVGSAMSENAEIPAKVNASANRTVAMDTSMKFTKPIPSNIQVGFATSRNAEISSKENALSNRTVAMDTSMEFTRPVPSNIQVGFASSENAEIPAKENDLSNRTVAMDTSMDFTRPVPSNIQVGFATSENAEVPSKENALSNRTVAMDTSMEFTRPVPSNIQVGFASSENAEIPAKENALSNRTVAMDTSMEFTRPVPSNIQVGFATSENAEISMKDTALANCTKAMNISMELTKPIPSNIQVGFATSENAEIPSKENALSNRTVAMDTSMEFTRPVPSNIQVGFASSENAEIPAKENALSNRTVAMDTSMEFTRPIPSNIQVGFASSKSAGAHNCGPREFAVGSDGQNVPNNISQQEFTAHCSEAHELLFERTQLPSCQIEESFSLVADPFKSKPRLISSPPTQNGIESVQIQNLSENVLDSKQAGMKPFQSVSAESNPPNIASTLLNEHQEMPSPKEGTGTDPFKSKPSPILSSLEEVAIPEPCENVAASTRISPLHSLSRSSDVSGSSGLQKTPLVTEEPDPLLDISNPFKSKSRLVSTPIKPTHEIATQMECDMESGPDTKEDAVQSTSGKGLAETDGDHCMLLDEPPPFLDVPSINVDISASTNNDSGANLLHTTIKNAEMSLRRIHSPDLDEMQPAPATEEISSPSKTMEHMDFDLIPNKGILSESTISRQLPFHEDEAVIIESSRISERADQSGDRKHAKRFRDHSLDCGAVDPQRPDDRLSKRLCQVRSETVSADRPKISSFVLGPDLSDDFSDSHYSNNSNASCGSASSSIEVIPNLDEIILNPEMWEAIKICEDLWSFKFKVSCLELKVHLKQTASGIVEGRNGHFVSLVTDSTKPIMCWAMNLLMDKLKTQEWDSLLHYSPNFLQMLGKLMNTINLNKRFIAETIIQRGLLNLTFTQNCFSGLIVSMKLHLCFKVTVQFDLLEKYSPHHIEVENIIGSVREMEVKNLIKGVKKDVYFIRNYFRDIKDYVKTLESFCK